MPKTIRIRKGLNIHLKGRAEKVSFTVPSDGLYAVSYTHLRAHET